MLEQGLPSPIVTRTYIVGDPGQFSPDVPRARILIFLNGLFRIPGTDYQIIDGASLSRHLVFKPYVLIVGDEVSVVTLP